MDNYNQPTRKDVAKLAGVTETIVSYVVNNNRYVAQEKREKVLKAIEELGYRPNSIARALKGKKSNHILFIADDIKNEHFGLIVEEMDKVAYDKGYLISLMAAREDADFVSKILSRQVDGIVISSTSISEVTILKLVDSQIPVVVLMNRDFSIADKLEAKIYTGLKDGIKRAVDYLVSLDRKKIIYVDRVSEKGNFSTDKDLRLKGYKKEMELLGLELKDDSIITGCHSEEELFNAITKRVENKFNFDAVIARNDKIAAVVLSALNASNIKVPEDVCIIGFDNSAISKVIKPSLTTIEMERPEIGRAIIEMLDHLIYHRQEEYPHTRYFQTKLIIRDSTK